MTQSHPSWKVKRFSSSKYATPCFVCCRTDEESEIARHFPSEVVLQHIPSISEVLLEHPQVQKLDRSAVAKFGAAARGTDWAKSFWTWYRRQCVTNPDLKLDRGAQRHIFDDLEVLWHQEADGSVTLKPLRERRRALHCEDLEAPVVACLRACNVLVVSNCDCPPIDHHDALARALSWALKSRRERITGVQDQGWRDLLKILIKSELPEALEMARVLPLFRNCGGTLVTPDRQLFPLRGSPEFRVAVAPLSLELLSETDGSIVQFLSRLRVTEARAIVVKDDGLNSR
jgi:hypothetical protein